VFVINSVIKQPTVGDNCYTCCIVSFQPFMVASINISYLILEVHCYHRGCLSQCPTKHLWICGAAALYKFVFVFVLCGVVCVSQRVCVQWLCVTVCVCAMTVCHSVCLCNDCVSQCVSVQWLCVTVCVCAMTVCHTVCLCNDCVSHCVSVQWLMFAGRKTQKIASRTAILHPWYVIVVIVMLLLMSVVTPAAMANIILRIPIMVVLLNKLDDSKLVPTFTFHFWSQIKWLTGTSRVLST